MSQQKIEVKSRVYGKRWAWNYKIWERHRGEWCFVAWGSDTSKARVRFLIKNWMPAIEVFEAMGRELAGKLKPRSKRPAPEKTT